MEGIFSSQVMYLRTARKTIGDDDLLLRKTPENRNELEIGNFYGNLVVLFFIAKGACHTTAAGGDLVHSDPWKGAQKVKSGAGSHEGLLVAVGMYVDSAGSP